MKLVHLFQLLLLGVAVFGRAIEEQIADTRVVTGDAEQLPYRFRYKVESQDSGDYKSQTESRDGDGVVTGMYRVLQPDVTYEGDCQQPGGSINTAAVISSDSTQQPSLKDVSAPIVNPLSSSSSSSAFLSRPVLSAVPGLINPLTTDVRDSTQEAFVSRPSSSQQQQIQTVSQNEDSTDAVTSSTPNEKMVIAPVLLATASAASLSSEKIPADIERLWQSLGEPSRPAQQTTADTGIVPTITSNGNSETVKAQAQPSEEIIVESKLPEGLSTLTKLPAFASNTQTVVDVNDVPVENTQEQSLPVVVQVPEIGPVVLTGKVQSSDTVPDSILSLFDSFEPTKRTIIKQYEEIDPLEAQPSEFSERILKDESVDSFVEAVESVPEESIHSNIESKTSETILPVVEVQSDEPIVAASAPEEALIDATVDNQETIESKSIPQTEETNADVDETAHEEEYSFKSDIDETIQPKNIETVESQVTDAHHQSDETINSEKERSFSTLTQSALGNVKNFTAPLTQLISSSVQNLTNPVTALLNSFNKNKSPTTVSPVTEATPVTAEPTVLPNPPAGKIETQEGEIQDIPSGKLIVTDHHNQEEAFTGGTDDGAVSDIPAVSQHTKQTILVSEDLPEVEAQRTLSTSEEEESLDLKKSIVGQNLESISIDVNDPTTRISQVVVEPVPSDEILQDSAEPNIEVSQDNTQVAVIDKKPTVSVGADPVPAVEAEGSTTDHLLVESSKVASLEETPNNQQETRAVVRETSSSNVPDILEIENVEESLKEVVPANENAELYQEVNADEPIAPETYVTIAEPVIYSHQLAAGPFYVSQPVAAISPHAYPMSVRQATARSIDSVAAARYGLRVQKFVPTYATLGNNAVPSLVYNQHRRQGHHYQKQQQPIQMHHYTTRFAPAAPIRSVKKQGEAYGMRYTSVQHQQQTPPTNSHHNVRPKAPKQPTWSPTFYSTYVY